MMDMQVISDRLDERAHENWLDFMTHCAEIAGFHLGLNFLGYENDAGDRRISLYELDKWLMQAPAQVVIAQIATAA